MSIELLDYIIKRQESILETLKNNSNEDVEVIKEQEKKVKALKDYKIRYEMAKLLGLENDSFYLSTNYIGIELENIDKLSEEDKKKFIDLNNKLNPNSDLRILQTRMQMANYLNLVENEELKANNYKGIEQVNARSLKFNLDETEYQKYENMLNNLKLQLQNGDIYDLNINKEISDHLKSIYNKINVEDDDKLKELFEKYQREFDITLKAAIEKKSGDSFEPIKNYQFAKHIKDISNIKPTLTLKETIKLFNNLKDSKEEKEQYEDLLEILITNLQYYYQKEENKTYLNQLIEQSKSNIDFRIDLKNKLNINEIDLNLKPEELKQYANIINKMFDEFEEDKKNKYIEFLEISIKNYSNDLNNIDKVNDALIQINNENFEKVLQDDLKGIKNLKFAHHHMYSFDGLIQEQIALLQKEKSKLQSKKSTFEMQDIRKETKIKEIDKEIEKLKKLYGSDKNNKAVNILNKEYNEKIDKEIEIQKEIEKLKELRTNVKSSIIKRMYDKKIEKRNNKLKKLSNSKIKIEKDQKQLMLPKTKIELMNGKKERKLESKVEVFEEREKDYKDAAKITGELGGLFSPIKETFYNYKSNKYKNKKERNKEILEELRNGKIKSNGSSTREMTQTALESLLNNNFQNEQVNTI